MVLRADQKKGRERHDFPGEQKGNRVGRQYDHRQRGYQQVWALKDGLDAWKNAGLPLERKQKAA